MNRIAIQRILHRENHAVEAQTREISSMTMEYAMWSKPAPPFGFRQCDGGQARSAALRNVSRGK